MSLKKPSATPKKVSREQALEALRAETRDDIQDQIRRLLAKPVHERTHFLRKRIVIGGSVI
jgi:hypothetical protein